MEKKPSEVTEVLDEYLSDYLFPERDDGKAPRFCPLCDKEGREGGRLALRGGRYGAFVACANYPNANSPAASPSRARTGRTAAEDG